MFFIIILNGIAAKKKPRLYLKKGFVANLKISQTYIFSMLKYYLLYYYTKIMVFELFSTEPVITEGFQNNNNVKTKLTQSQLDETAK